MKFAPYSFSTISKYLQCPRAFKYWKIDKLPKKLHDDSALKKGSAIHSILEQYPQKSASEFNDIVERFAQTEVGKKYLNADQSFNEIMVALDKQLNATLDKKEMLFKGYVDYVCIIDDTLHIVDWKTGKFRELRWVSFDQLVFYAIYFFRTYNNINDIVVSFVYVEHENAYHELHLERKYLSNYIKDMIEPIKMIEADQTFEKKESKLCEWCDYYEHCFDINNNKT